MGGKNDAAMLYSKVSWRELVFLGVRKTTINVNNEACEV